MLAVIARASEAKQFGSGAAGLRSRTSVVAMSDQIAFNLR